MCALTLVCGSAADSQPDKKKPAEVALPDTATVPKIDSRAWVLTDLQSGERLAGAEDDRRLPMASTTKIMVAILTLEDANLDEEVVVSEKAASFAVPIYSNVGLYPGDTLSVRELLQASLIASGDDAVYALAEHLGGGSAETFVQNMNDRAGKMGLEDTSFENPSGLDGREHYSSASDLAEMTRVAFEYPLFREMVATPSTVITTADREIPLASTNELLASYGPTTGVKTGTTPGAGSSLVASAGAGDESYVAVFLDSREDRFGAAVRALEHGFTAYERPKLVTEGDLYTTTEVPFRRAQRVGLVAGDTVTGLVNADSKVEREIEVVEELPRSAKPGTRLGTVVATVDGEPVGESALVAKRGYDEASFWERSWYTVSGVFTEE